MIAMAKQLSRVVVLTNPETRNAEVFRPGDDVPAWAREVITNPTAWDGGDTADSTPEPPKQPEPLKDPEPPKEPEPPSNPAGDGTGDDPKDAIEEPPRAGRGSSLEAWQGYADALGIEYANDATRDDIVAAVDAAKA